MDEDEVAADFANFLCESLRELIDDDEIEFNWCSPVMALVPKVADDSSFHGLIFRGLQYKHIQIDYVRQLIRRQQHKNNNFLREYANAMVSAMIREFDLKKGTLLLRASLVSFFYIELIYKCANADLIEENDPIFLRGETLQKAVLFLLTDTELPFKCFKTIFQATEEKKNNYFNVVARFMEEELCLGPIHVDNNYPYEEGKNLLAFVYNMWVTSSEFGRTMFVKIEMSLGNGMLVVTDYCIVMDCLIQSPQDVQLLRESGVIESYLRDDQNVVDLFDMVVMGVPSSTHFCYSDLFNEVNKHCVQTWNSWKAKFRRNYFRDNNQLEATSFMFAIYVILPVTVLPVLSYYKGGG